jgi:hypothetical protein
MGRLSHEEKMNVVAAGSTDCRRSVVRWPALFAWRAVQNGARSVPVPISLTSSCFCAARRYVLPMKLTKVEDQAIQARIAFIVGAETFDRLFAGIRFDEADGPLLYVYAKDEAVAMEIEDDYSLQIAIVASKITGRIIELVVVLPKVLN